MTFCCTWCPNLRVSRKKTKVRSTSTGTCTLKASSPVFLCHYFTYVCIHVYTNLYKMLFLLPKQPCILKNTSSSWLFSVLYVYLFSFTLKSQCKWENSVTPHPLFNWISGAGAMFACHYWESHSTTFLGPVSSGILIQSTFLKAEILLCRCYSSGSQPELCFPISSPGQGSTARFQPSLLPSESSQSFLFDLA